LANHRQTRCPVFRTARDGLPLRGPRRSFDAAQPGRASRAASRVTSPHPPSPITHPNAKNLPERTSSREVFSTANRLANGLRNSVFMYPDIFSWLHHNAAFEYQLIIIVKPQYHINASFGFSLVYAIRFAQSLNINIPGYPVIEKKHRCRSINTIEFDRIEIFLLAYKNDTVIIWRGDNVIMPDDDHLVIGIILLRQQNIRAQQRHDTTRHHQHCEPDKRGSGE
jgi:hypothetical protein